MTQKSAPAAPLSVEGLAAHLSGHQRLLGIDLGTKTMGLAVSDSGLAIASPREVLKRKNFSRDIEPLLALCRSENVGGIVIGLPVNMNGTEGPRAQSTRAFAKNLGEVTDIPIALWDERLSTVAAERAMIEADMSRAKRASRIDSVAACLILQGVLDRIRRLRDKS